MTRQNLGRVLNLSTRPTLETAKQTLGYLPTHPHPRGGGGDFLLVRVEADRIGTLLSQSIVKGSKLLLAAPY